MKIHIHAMPYPYILLYYTPANTHHGFTHIHSLAGKHEHTHTH